MAEEKSSENEKAREASPILPDDAISGSALIAVIAIMSFLAALTLGAVQIVHGKAAEWRADVTKEITIQIRPAEQGNLDNDVRRVVEIAKKNQNVVDVRSFTKEESERLLEPWLGAGIDFSSLPVPRLVRIRLKNPQDSNFTDLRNALSAGVPNAMLDDHHNWSERIASASNAIGLIGTALLVLMLIATVLSVSFATRGAVAANRSAVEVLHFVGARDSYVANAFQKHFLMVGLKGGAIGAAAAALLFLLLHFLGDATAGGGTILGRLSLSAVGYLEIGGIIGFVTLVAGIASRLTVHRTLQTID